jgi:hypothetical protein
VTLGIQLVLSALVIGAVLVYAAITARTTIYAITDRRVVMRVGVVLPTTINIPFHTIGAASAGEYKDGTGQISLAILPPDRLGFIHLWPHVRAWKLRWPEPTLRGLRETSKVAAIIRDAAAACGPIVSYSAASITTPPQTQSGLRVNSSLSTAHKAATS